MERRLLKDFQIGLVEGLMQDAIASAEKGPKDVFSKIAKAIGRRTSQGSKKKDWNAVARQRSVARDPIGSTAEGAERRHRQSVRRYILDHQKDSLFSMDTDKLVEYNPRLADIAPAARVAYAKFKIPKIKQEYDENTAAGVGPDDVFENAPTVAVVDETKKSSIARPRPKSARKSSPMASPGVLPFPGSPTASVAKKTTAVAKTTATTSTSATTPVTATAPTTATAPVTVTATTAAPTTSTAVEPTNVSKPSESAVKDPAATALPAVGVTVKVEPEPPSGTAKDGVGAQESGPAEETVVGEGTSKVDVKGETGDAVGGDKDGGKDADKDKGKSLKPESPKRSASPRKQGGKSKVTGEILTGWL